MAKVDIILPVLNAMRFLPEWYEKNIRQSSFRDFRIIAVDNGSTDGTQDFVRSWETEAALLFHQNETNLGAEGSIAHAWKLVEAPYMLFLPADDWLAPNYLEDAVAILDAYAHVGLVCGREYVYFYDDEGRLKKSMERQCPYSRPGEYPGRPFTTLAINYPADLIVSRCSFLERVGGHDLLTDGTAPPATALLQTVSSVYYTDKDHCYFGKHPGRVSEEWEATGRYFRLWHSWFNHMFYLSSTSDSDRATLVILEANRVTGLSLPQLYSHMHAHGDKHYRREAHARRDTILLRMLEIILAQFRIIDQRQMNGLAGPLGSINDALQIASVLKNTAYRENVIRELGYHGINLS